MKFFPRFRLLLSLCSLLSVLFLSASFSFGDRDSADLSEVVIDSEPADTLVYLCRLGSDASPTRPEVVALAHGHSLPKGSVVGKGGEKLFLSWKQDSHILLLHPYCKPLAITVPAGNLPPAGPAKHYGPYRLEFLPGGENRYWLAQHGLKIVAGLGLLIVALGVPLAVAVRQLRQRSLEVAEKDDKERKLSNLVAKTDTSDPLIGSKLENYRIIQALGQGGMARVYRALPEDNLDEKLAVAIKVMSGDLAQDPEMLRRFDRERRVYDQLHHPNIVRVLACGSQGSVYFMVMELIRGTTLKSYVMSDGLAPKKALKLMTPVFEAVSFAHSKGIVHRDLKPDNIMITDQGVVKVMDFGLARSHSYTQITGTGSVLGTPAYMAPEQIQGDLNAASDQYALGIIFFQLLTGRLPFDDDNPVTLILSHLQKPVPSLKSLKPDCEKVQTVVERMLAKSPEQRYRDLEHALAALRHAC